MSTDTALRLLADPTRRELLRSLITADTETISIEALAAALTRTDWLSYAEPGDVGIVLHHVHLPKLADEDVIDWEPGSGTIRYRPTDPIEGLLADLPSGTE